MKRERETRVMHRSSLEADKLHGIRICDWCQLFESLDIRRAGRWCERNSPVGQALDIVVMTNEFNPHSYVRCDSIEATLVEVHES